MPIHITLEKIGLLTCVIINMSIVFNYSKIWTTVNIFLQKEEPNLLLRQLKKKWRQYRLSPTSYVFFLFHEVGIYSVVVQTNLWKPTVSAEPLYSKHQERGWDEWGETAAILLTLHRPCPKFEQEVKPLSTLPYLFLTFAFFLM